MSEDLPPLDRSTISKHDALRHAIGQYVIAFATLEHMLSVFGAAILAIDLRTVQFLWRDTGIKAKIQITRRAGAELLGKDSQAFRELAGILNRLDACISFRNDLLHGTFVNGTQHGKIGKSLSLLFDGFKELTPQAIDSQCQTVTQVSVDSATTLLNISAALAAKRSESASGS